MQARSTYEWGQSKVEQVTHMSREQRDSNACQRRLKQMEAKRIKQAKREAQKAEQP